MAEQLSVSLDNEHISSNSIEPSKSFRKFDVSSHHNSALSEENCKKQPGVTYMFRSHVVGYTEY